MNKYKKLSYVKHLEAHINQDIEDYIHYQE